MGGPVIFFRLPKYRAQGRLAVAEIGFLPFGVVAPAVEAGGKIEGQITLTATIGNASHQDTFAFRVFGEDRPGRGQLAVVDPSGLTSRMLENLGFRTRPWSGESAPLVVIGRNALKNDAGLAARLEPYVRAGGGPWSVPRTRNG